MKSVLGIDAAWSAHNASGVALVVRALRGWELKAVSASYEDFYNTCGEPFSGRSSTTHAEPDVGRLLNASRRFCRDKPQLIAVDMPLARTRIASRRVSDDAVTALYSRYKCGTHSPTLDRPGCVSVRLTRSFALADYKLATTYEAVGATKKSLIEVYPHPALIQLTSESERLRYKVSKISRYWREIDRAGRLRRLKAVWVSITELLERHISGVRTLMPLPSDFTATSQLKAYEDALDAVVCAWVGICVLERKAEPFGDLDSAIWIPSIRDI